MLLMEVVRKQLKRKWAFSNMVSMVRFHLMNYIIQVQFIFRFYKWRLYTQAKAYYTNKKVRLDKCLIGPLILYLITNSYFFSNLTLSM